MKVVALKKGFFGGQVQREGAEFAISDKKQLGNWMRIEEPKVEKPKPKKAKVKKEEVASNQD